MDPLIIHKQIHTHTSNTTYTNIYTTVSCVYTYTRMAPRIADHPQDQRLHLTTTRTDERFDLWRIIITVLLLHTPVIPLYLYITSRCIISAGDCYILQVEVMY